MYLRGVVPIWEVPRRSMGLGGLFLKSPLNALYTLKIRIRIEKPSISIPFSSFYSGSNDEYSPYLIAREEKCADMRKI